VFACGFCHRADGPGGPENANLAGQPQAYLAQQMRDFRSGARKTAVAGRNTALMISLAKDITDAEIEAAASYFSALKPRRTISVVETDAVPKTFIMSNHYAVAKGDEKEALGRRIIEVPEDLERFVSRDTRVRFIAYVPPGSVKSGRELATSGGGGKTQACAGCHGEDLRGLEPIPGIAGRSPSYLARQLYDFKSGARKGHDSVSMMPVVEKLTLDDMLILSAYVASLAP
jgi:cytochrome c553